jgi:hypothetical protein
MSYSTSTSNIFGQSTDLNESSVDSIIQVAIAQGSSNPLHRSLLQIAGGALTFKGGWEVNTNPILKDGEGQSGNVYIALTSGVFNGDIIGIQDWVIYNGSTWDWFDNPDAEPPIVNAGKTSVHYFDGTKTFKAVDYAGLTSKPVLGTASAINVGGLTDNLLPLATDLTMGGQVFTSANLGGKWYLNPTDVQSGFNKSFGTTAGTVANGLITQTALNAKEPTIVKNTAFNKDFGIISGTIAEGLATQTALNAKEPTIVKNTAFNKDFGTSSGTIAEGLATQTALNAKEPTIVKNTAFNKDFGTSSGTVAEGLATQTALNGKEPTIVKNTAFNKDFGTTAGTIAEGLATQTALNGKEPTIVKNTAFNKDFGIISGTIAEGLATQTALNGKEPTIVKNTAFNKDFGTSSGTVAEGLATQTALNGKANSSHVHTQSEVVGLISALSSKATIDDTNSTSATTYSSAKINTLVETLVSGLKFVSTWNASSNTPTLTDGSGIIGNYYIVNVNGSTNLGGITDWKIGDWVVRSGGSPNIWSKIDQTNDVLTVNNKIGNVVLNSSDIAENVNLYYMEERVAANSTVVANKNHTTNISNPHNVSKSQVGLSLVDNTSDLNKPVSSATQTALNGKENIISAIGEVGQFLNSSKTYSFPDNLKNTNSSIVVGAANIEVKVGNISALNMTNNTFDVRTNLTLNGIGVLNAINAKEPIINKNTAFNKNFGFATGQVPDGLLTQNQLNIKQNKIGDISNSKITVSPSSVYLTGFMFDNPHEGKIALASSGTFPHYAYDGNNETFYTGDIKYKAGTGNNDPTSGTILSNTITTNSYVGEWLQIQYPSALTINKFKILPIINASLRYKDTSPRDFKIFVSDTGLTNSWTEVFSITNYTSWTTEFSHFSFPATTGIYWRLAVNKVGNGNDDIGPEVRLIIAAIEMWKDDIGDITAEIINTGSLNVNGVNISSSLTSKEPLLATANNTALTFLSGDRTFKEPFNQQLNTSNEATFQNVYTSGAGYYLGNTLTSLNKNGSNLQLINNSQTGLIMDNAGNISIPKSMTINGNLEIIGALTNITMNNLEIGDALVIANADTSSGKTNTMIDNSLSGFLVEHNNGFGTANYSGLIRDGSNSDKTFFLTKNDLLNGDVPQINSLGQLKLDAVRAKTVYFDHNRNKNTNIFFNSIDYNPSPSTLNFSTDAEVRLSIANTKVSSIFPILGKQTYLQLKTSGDYEVVLTNTNQQYMIFDGSYTGLTTKQSGGIVPVDITVGGRIGRAFEMTDNALDGRIARFSWTVLSNIFAAGIVQFWLVSNDSSGTYYSEPSGLLNYQDTMWKQTSGDFLITLGAGTRHSIAASCTTPDRRLQITKATFTITLV